MMSNISFYSYGDLIKNRNDFRITDREGINRFDTPNALFYKLVFYFSDESGLLGLDGINGFTDDVTKGLEGIDVKKDRIKNTAYNFLLLNDELERAEMLKNFLILLSEINTKSPWYFQEISGIDSALERKVFSEGELKIEDKPGQFTIKCLNDAYDDRIGTLLDLYRACCFSYQNKKEIVPRNLRKFNMGILLFSAPIRGKGGIYGDTNNRIKIPQGDETNFYIPSTKLIEFRNCEFDYNSAKSPFATLNTSEAPFSPEYTITINFDDCYESRYNEIMQQVVTDFINIDIKSQREDNNLKDINSKGKYLSIDEGIQKESMEDTLKERNIERKELVDDYFKNTKFGDSVSKLEGSTDMGEVAPPLKGKSMLTNAFEGKAKAIGDLIKDAVQIPSVKTTTNIHDIGGVSNYGEFEYLNRINGSDGFLGTIAQQAVGLGVKTLRDEVSKLYLGNLYEISVSDVLDITKRAISGNVADTIGAIKNLSPDSSSKFPESKEELHSNTKQREITSDKPLEVLPGYVKARTNLLNKLNKKSSIRNTL